MLDIPVIIDNCPFGANIIAELTTKYAVICLEIEIPKSDFRSPLLQVYQEASFKSGLETGRLVIITDPVRISVILRLLGVVAGKGVCVRMPTCPPLIPFHNDAVSNNH